MDKKKADPKASQQNKHPNDTKVHIACPYEYRLLEQLLREQTNRELLDKIVGTTNSPEYVHRLRRREESGVNIGMEWVSGLNRDGRKVRWGEYYLHPEDRERVRAALGEQHGKTQ